MSNSAIQAFNLSKQYRIGGRRRVPKRFTEAVIDAVISPLRRLHSLGQPMNPDELIWALKDISFGVKYGDVIGIIGRNGAGKSTLLKIFSRITTPTEGRAEIHGRVGSLLEVGTGFHSELTGRENVYLNGAILGMKRAEINRKFDEIIQFAEIDQFIDTPVKRYSSGMYMRLAFAVAAHLEPEILIVDEVLAVGDAAFQEKCLGKMGDVAKEGRTVLFVSHNMGAIAQMCSRCLLLESGKLILDGDTNTVIQQYLSKGKSQEPMLEFKPRQSDAYFTALALSDPDGHIMTRFDIRKPIKVFMGFTIKRPMRGLEADVVVHNFKGERLFYSSNDQSDTPLYFDQAGDHYASIEIPGQLLPPGQYSITVALHRPNIQTYDRYDNVLVFEVEEMGSGREKYYGQDLGQILVNLNWTRENGMP